MRNILIAIASIVTIYFIATSLFVEKSIRVVSPAPKFAQKNLRIVSLAPNLTEIIFHLERENCLVGRSSASKYFKEAKNIPIVGDFGIPSIEQLLLAKPDIVVATALKDPSIQEIIKKAGIKFHLLPTSSIDEYYKTVKTLGDILDANINAKQEILRIKNGLKKSLSQINKISDAKRPKVFWEIWNPPLMTVGNQSFLNDFIYYAGGQNIAENQDKGYFNISQEWVIASAPDVIIAPSIGKNIINQMSSQLGWKSTPAVVNNRIYGNLDQNILYLLGPKMLDAIQMIYNCIYEKDKKGF